MAQHDYVIDNQSFPATRSDLNSLFQAIASCNSGATAPSTTYANQLWYDTANNKLYIRNEDNDAWIELLKLDQTGDHLEKIGNTITLDGTGNMSLAGDLTVDTDTLFVDASENAVGIGTTSPNSSSTLHVKDQTDIAMSNDADGQITIEGNGYSGAIALNATGMQIYQNSNARSLIFGNNETEQMRIDSSGNVLVGKTSNDFSTNGVILRGTGEVLVTRASNVATFRRNTTDGEIIGFRKDSTTVGSIVTSGGTMSIGSTSGSGAYIMFHDNTVRPATSAGNNRDNIIDLGTSSVRFNDAFITNGVTTGSDQNEKQQIASLTDAEIAAAKRISNGFKTFKWSDAVTAKGDNARTHTGVIAQEVRTALEAEGLNAGNYAFFMSDTWWETQTDVLAVAAVEAQDAVLDDDGNIVTEAVEAVEAQDAYTRIDTYDTADEAPEGATERTRLGIRYPELLAFVGAATEQRLADIETRLTALEA